MLSLALTRKNGKKEISCLEIHRSEVILAVRYQITIKLVEIKNYPLVDQNLPIDVRSDRVVVSKCRGRRHR